MEPDDPHAGASPGRPAPQSLGRGLVAATARTSGRILPGLIMPASVLPRALVLTALFAPLGSLLGLAWLARGSEQLTLGEFTEFKLAFACALGVVVTPANAYAVITSQPPREAGQ